MQRSENFVPYAEASHMPSLVAESIDDFCNERKSLDHWLLDILDFVLYNTTSPLESSYLKNTVLLPE